MPGLNPASRRFLAKFGRQHGDYVLAANKLRVLMEDLLANFKGQLHNITSRAKDCDSLRVKLLKKRYKDPENELTDYLGVRVITYFDDTVDTVVAALKGEFQIDSANSVDKRSILGPNEFGYRSVHLIARLKSPRIRSMEYRSLAAATFEIQVRSILEHAWAEIEHEVAYKSGIEFPLAEARLLASLAGTLEILDREFRQLRSIRERLVSDHKARFFRKEGLAEPLDAARMIAALEARFPESPKLRAGSERMILLALKDIDVKTPEQLLARIRGRRFNNELREYAVLSSLAPERVAQQVLLMIAIAISSPTMIEDYFPDLIDDPGIANLLDRLL